MSAFAVPLLILSAGAGAVSSMQQASARRDAAEHNARMAMLEAEAAEREGRRERERLRRARAATLGKQRAAFAAAGVEIDEGTPLEVLADTAYQYDLDLEASRYNAKIAGTRARSRAAYQRKSASQAQTAGILGATQSLLSGGYKIANR